MGRPKKTENSGEQKKGTRGRPRKATTFDNALNSDPVFMKQHLEDAKRTYQENLAFLEKIRNGDVKDCQFDPKTGTIIEKPVSMDVRVKAIAQINAMSLHKVMADKRDPGREKDTGKGVDHEASLRRIEEARKRDADIAKAVAEEKAKREGKLEKLPAAAGGVMS